METVKNIIEIIRQIDIDKGIEEIKKNFYKIPKEELGLYLSSLKNIYLITPKITNLDIKNHDLQKSILIYLAIHGLTHSDNEFDSKLKTFDIIKTLEEEVKDKILKGYIISGIAIFKFNEADILYYKKLIIKDFHDKGGFEPHLWGVKVNWNLFQDILKTFKKEKLEILKEKYNKITWNYFVMLSSL
ncbi:MAG: hypothetical protein QXD43_05910 [Candidatus Aenigmatarchaeota archaeon]